MSTAASPENSAMPRPVVALRPITAVSPSLAEILRVCPLHAALSRLPELKAFILGNPKAWVGTAYHEVLEFIQKGRGEGTTEDEIIDSLWSSAIATLQQRAALHPLDSRFAMPERWPGYHLALACTRLKAKQLLEERRLARVTSTHHSDKSDQVLEERFTAFGGKLVGRPDSVTDEAIQDYKSGNIYDDTPDGPAVKDGYLRQLRLYGHLVREAQGRCPPKGRLLPMKGEAVEIDLEPAACAAEAADAVALLDSFNGQLTTAVDIKELANPGPASCKWCEYKALCPAFWENISPAWWPDLGSGAVRGNLSLPPATIHNGRACSLSLAVTAGTIASAEATIGPLEHSLHPALSGMEAGEEVRIINLFMRRDGQLSPSDTAICIRDSCCPELALPNT